MNEIQNANTDESRQAGVTENNSIQDGSKSGIGTGKRVGLYGCGFLLLGIVIVAAIIYLTGVYVPFVGSEGAGP